MVVREQDDRSGRARSVTKIRNRLKWLQKGGKLGRKAPYGLLQKAETKVLKPPEETAFSRL